MKSAPKAKKKHKGLIIFLCVLFALLFAVGAVAWRYRMGIEILLGGLGKSSEQLAEERSDYERRTQELLDKLSGGEMSLSALSEADRERLKNGEITPSEAIALIMGIPTAATESPDATTAPSVTTSPDATTAPSVTASPDATTAPGETTSPDETAAPDTTTAPAATATTSPDTTTSPAATTVPAATTATTTAAEAVRPVQTIIADIYLLRAEFLNKLDLLIAEGKTEILEASKNVPGLVIDIGTVNRYLDRGEALEKECDARMKELLAEMSASLKASGGDLSLVDEARALYVEEKKLYKSELMSKYKKYL